MRTILLLITYLCFSESADIGTVTLLQESISLTENDANFTTINVSLDVKDNITGLPVDLAANVTVSVRCMLTTSNIGYSSALFSPVEVLGGQSTSASIPIRDLSTGRLNAVQCYAISNITSSSQFTKSTSTSLSRPFLIRPVPKLNFCSDVVVLSASSLTGQFKVRLSDAVLVNNVTVTCTTTRPSSMSVLPLQVNITDQIVQVGAIEAQILYTTVTQGGPVKVICMAQSVGGHQYLSLTSQASTTLAIETGKLELYPHIASVYNTSFKTYLLLSKNEDTKITCKVQVFNKSANAIQALTTPSCDIKPPDVLTPPPPPNSTTVAATTENVTNTTTNVTTEATTDNTTDVTPFDVTTNNTTDVQNITDAATTTETVTTEAITTTAQTTTTQTTTTQATTSTTQATTSTTQSTASTLPTTITTANATVNTTIDYNWKLTQNEFEGSSSLLKTLEVVRTSQPTEKTNEVIVVTCCAPLASPLYGSQTATMIAVASLTPDRDVNLTIAGSTGSDSERVIEMPAYVKLAPCPCDLTSGHCDVHCCCDNDCSFDESKDFTCLKGPYGGQESETPHRSCYSNKYIKEDWFPLLCVESENSALLGLFYNTESALKTSTVYSDRVSSYSPQFSFMETDSHAVEEASSLYKHGSSIQTDQGDSQPRRGILALPQRTMMGECVATFPVRYLEELNTNCNYKLSQDICNENSPLSAWVYAESTTVIDPQCPKTPEILSDGGSTTVVEVSVDYYCTDDVSTYVNSLKTKEDVTPNSSSLFNYVLPDTESTCGVNSTNCTSTTEAPTVSPVATTSTQMKRCSWDTSYKRPPKPVLTGSVCHNSVLSVHYNFTWQGQSLMLLNATVIMGNLPLQQTRSVNKTVTYWEVVEYNDTTTTLAPVNTSATTPSNSTVNTTVASPQSNVITKRESRTRIEQEVMTGQTVLTQVYRVNFVHNATVSNVTDNITRSEGVFHRSGNPGYKIGKPIISGVQVNQSNSTFKYMETNVLNRIGLWKPDVGGSCYSAEKTDVLFGQDTITGCIVRLGISELNDCDYLRRLILNRQNNIMASDYIYQLGFPNTSEVAGWVKVYREDMSSIIASTTTVEPISTTVTSTTTNSTNATMDSVTDTYLNNSYNLLDQVVGICPDIPSGIHIDILYAESGFLQGSSVYEIVGAKISYTKSTWQLDCSGSSAPNCYDNNTSSDVNSTVSTPEVQSFLLTSTVRYVQVPPEPVTPVIKYWTSYDESLCQSDSCWSEMLYVLTESYQGESRPYSLGFGLLSMFFVVGVFMISRPWW